MEMLFVFKDRDYELFNGDCLEVMDKLIEMNIKVDAIITDPLFGTTRCKWDSIFPFDEMWNRFNKLIKDNGVIVLFGNQPFTSQLINSSLKDFRYEIIWEKEQLGKIYEDISIFYKHQPTYNPQMREGFKPQHSGTSRDRSRLHPTQKPISLLEYLIKTYTNENEVVLDFAMGLGSTGVGCMNTNRKFIGIELDEKYFNIAKERLEDTINKIPKITGSDK